MRTSDCFIGGTWSPSESTEYLDVINPATEEVLGQVSAGAPVDVDRAVAAASAAFAGWAYGTSVEERCDLVERLAAAIDAHSEDLTGLVVTEIGMPTRIARWAQVGLAAVDLRGAIGGAHETEWSEAFDNTVVVKSPVGVVGCITPWNYPLHQITAKIGPALVAGCVVVVKPSEVAPLSPKVLMDMAHKVGFPPGVINQINGLGPVVGEALAGHPDVDMLSFTGSSHVGKRVAAIAAGQIKRLALELGGKSASVFGAVADLETAVKTTMRSTYMNAGQSCNALTRMVVPRRDLAAVEEIAAAVAASYTPGHPADARARLGPMVNKRQQERVLAYIHSGISEGAKLVAGGAEAPLERGYFVKPTVFSEVASGMKIAQEEIFGPVLSILPYDGSIDDAIAIANDTVYGIAAAIWSDEDDERDLLVERIRAAQIEVQGGRFNPRAPFGGMRQSGLGREGGKFGVEEYVELKSVQR